MDSIQTHKAVFPIPPPKNTVFFLHQPDPNSIQNICFQTTPNTYSVATKKVPILGLENNYSRFAFKKKERLSDFLKRLCIMLQSGETDFKFSCDESTGNSMVVAAAGGSVGKVNVFSGRLFFPQPDEKL